MNERLARIIAQKREQGPKSLRRYLYYLTTSKDVSIRDLKDFVKAHEHLDGQRCAHPFSEAKKCPDCITRRSMKFARRDLESYSGKASRFTGITVRHAFPRAFAR